MIGLILEERTPSLNVYRNLHWSAKKQLTGRYQWLLKGLTQARFNIKCKVVIVRSYRAVELDYDNLVGGCKSLVDAMKHNKIIVDDNSEWVDIEYKQEKSSKKYTFISIDPFTQIEINEL